MRFTLRKADTMSTKDFSTLELEGVADLNQMVREECGPMLDAYEREYSRLKAAHPVFSKAWGVPVMHPHRFMNIVAALAYSPECCGGWVDIGTYDGALVMILRHLGVDAYGVETFDWKDMWKLLCIEDMINVTVNAPSVISVLNYAHNFEPREFIGRLLQTYGEPDVLLVDREERTPHSNNRLWFNDDTMKDLGFSEVIAFPTLAKQNLDYGRELLVRRK